MDLLPIYVEDHLALSLAGVRLARRAASENRGTDLGRALSTLASELDEDRQVLKDVARALGRGPSLVKETAAVLGELAGRLKPNGRVLSYSALSRLWEIEALAAGTDSRRLLWRLLGKSAGRDRRLAGFEFEPLEERARAQHELLERLHQRAAREAFVPGHAAGVGAPATATR